MKMVLLTQPLCLLLMKILTNKNFLFLHLNLMYQQKVYLFLKNFLH